MSEENKCIGKPNCLHIMKGPHACPLQIDLYHNYATNYCTCCEECEHECLIECPHETEL